MIIPRWQVVRRDCLDQVANAPDFNVNLTPASEAPAAAVVAGWEPWKLGQAVPLIWEKAIYVESCDDY